MFEIILVMIDNIRLSKKFKGTKQQAEMYAFDLYIGNPLVECYEIVSISEN